MSVFDPRNDYWSQEEDETLTRLWGEGASVNAIAAELSKRSRSAVTGRARRLDLAMRASPIQYRSPERDRQRSAGFLAAREAIASEATRATYQDYLTDSSLSNAAFDREVRMARLKADCR